MEELTGQVKKLSISPLPMVKTENSEKQSKEINRGTGGGGAQTTINGKEHEKKTLLRTEFNLKSYTRDAEIVVSEKNPTMQFIYSRGKFAKDVLEREAEFYRKTPKSRLQGTMRPDECFFDELRKILFYIEKKTQNTPGSTAEKGQTPVTKRKHLAKRFPELKICYIYCVNDWYARNYPSEISLMKDNDIPVYIRDDRNKYKINVVDFMINYQLPACCKGAIMFPLRSKLICSICREDNFKCKSCDTFHLIKNFKGMKCIGCSEYFCTECLDGGMFGKDIKWENHPYEQEDWLCKKCFSNTRDYHNINSKN